MNAETLRESASKDLGDIDGQWLLRRLEAMIKKYVSLPGDGALVVAVWSLFALCADAFRHLPILGLTSPGPGSGKTVLLTLLQRLIPRAYLTSDITPSVLFRLTQEDRPTLLIDEADLLLTDNPHMVRILNGSHTRGSTIFRNVPDEQGRFTTGHFTADYPKAIAGIGLVQNDALASRMISLLMLPLGPNERMATLPLEPGPEMMLLQETAVRWAESVRQGLRVADPEMPTCLHNRQRDNWRPFIAIADRLGGEYPQRVRDIACAYVSKLSRHDDPLLLLSACRSAFQQGGSKGKITSEELLRLLNEMDDQPWGDMNDGCGMTPVQLSRRLSGFGIKPKKIRPVGPHGETLSPKQGYKIDDFRSAFDRYSLGE